MGRNSSKMGLAAIIIALSGMLLVSGCDSFFQNNNVSADTDSRSVPVLPDTPKASDEFFAMDTIITLEADELSCLLPHTDYSQIVLKNGTIAMPEAMEIDLGAVAKGYVGDQIAEIMRNHGVVSAILNLGGNVSLIGRSPEGFPWRVGIRSPYGEGNMGVLEAEDVHIITSGGYERYFVGEDGKWLLIIPCRKQMERIRMPGPAG